MKRLLFLFVVVLISGCAENIEVDEEGFEVEVLVENLDTPWAIDFFSDGGMIFTERNGRIGVYDKGEVKIIGNIEVSEISESGLMGIAVDSDFSENKYIYVYYTTKDGKNRVSRFKFDGENIENEFILLDNIPSARFHDGGRIKFGPDGKLYVTTGDATDPSSAQDINSLAGKILRLNKDGGIPADNPFGNYVYSYGHRNPQGIDWHPISGKLYSSEHGPTRNDEINIIIKGGNYGWPVECDEVSGEFINAIRCFSEFTLAPSGIAFYGGDLYVTGLRGKQLRRIVFDEEFKTVLKEEELFSDLGRIRVVVEHEGYLYIATSNRDGRGSSKFDDDKIMRIRYVTKVVEIDNGEEIIKVNVEIVDDSEERSKGLMFREELGENEGMFFVFEDSSVRNFWMKNTLIPLDIIFVSEDFSILNIEGAEPCVEDPCRVYSSKGEARYVLEVNKGFSEKNNIQEGGDVKLI